MFFTSEQFQEEVKRWENRLVKTCKQCNGVGSIPSDKGLHKMCSCMEKAILNSNLVSYGIPRKYLNESWSWEGCTSQQFVKKCKSYSDNFQQNYFSGRGIYLYGSQGRGKSTMEALIARDVGAKINPDTNRYYRAGFAIYEDLVQLSHQSRQDRNARYKLDTFIEVPELLIIDNVGSETGLGSETKHSTRLLEFILRKRDNACMPTIISSNFTPEELTKNYSDTVHDFVEQNCELISVTGDNFRKKSNVDELMEEFDLGVEDDNEW